MPRQRLGVVLLLPPPVAGEVDVLRRATGATNVEQLAPHLTLVPPVNVRDDDLESAQDLLRDAAARTRPFTVTLGPARTFLPTNPVLFLEIGGDVAAVDALRDKVFRPPLERTLTWPFHPHVTVLDTGDEARIRAATEALADYRAEVTFEGVHLLREEEGRVWKPAFEAAFGRPAVVGRGGRELELEVGGKLVGPVEAWADAAWRSYELGRYGAEWEGEHLSVTARLEGAVVGIAAGEVRPDTGEGYLDSLMVAAAHRGEGIGAQLVAAYGSAAAERGATHLTLDTEVGGDGEGFYERLGFERLHVMPRWRFDRDYVRFRRAL